MTEKVINMDEFNRMATAILVKYMEWENIPPSERIKNLESFNKWLQEYTQLEIKFENQNEEK